MPNSFLLRIKSWRKNEKLRERLTEGVLAAYVVLIPFQWKFPPISLMIMLLGALFLFFMEKDYLRRMRSNRYLTAVLLYFGWVLIGLTYSDYPDEGGKDIQVQIALMAWPVGLVTLASVTADMVRRLLMYFVRALAVSCILCLSLAFGNYMEDGLSTHFFYRNVAAWDLVPQHYMSMYISFGVLILAYRWLRSRDKLSRWAKIELASIAVLFLVMQGLLSVRIQFIAMPIALIPFLSLAVKGRRLGRKALFKGGVVILGFLIAIAILPGTQRRVIETYHEIRSFNEVVDKKQTNHRVYLWKYGAEVIGENWLLGTGTGAANKALHEKLIPVDAQFWDGQSVYYLRDKEYNVHNVFLQAWMTHGIIGFVLICIILLGPLIRAVRKKDAFLTSFLLLTFVSFLTESMFERQAGSLWFGCFYALLVVIQSQRLNTE